MFEVFRDMAWLGLYRELIEAAFLPNATAAAILLVAFEASVGLAILGPARWARGGLIAAILALVVGVLILGLWAFLLATRKVREVARGERGMWFHIAPETITALLLLGGGASLLLTDAAWARLLAGVAVGALLYTVVNSPGHYADLGQPGPVAMFGALAVVPQVASSPSSSREPGCGRGAATR